MGPPLNPLAFSLCFFREPPPPSLKTEASLELLSSFLPQHMPASSLPSLPRHPLFHIPPSGAGETVQSLCCLQTSFPGPVRLSPQPTLTHPCLGSRTRKGHDHPSLLKTQTSPISLQG